MMADKIEGFLTFDINSGSFWITKEGAPLTQINFGDTFEVKVDDKWIETGIEITSDDEGALLFKLKNTAFSGILDDLEVRI
ncbi:hypothetical protein DYE49_09770 [Treponema rectale]|uniref:DUF5348 domain-containing protein n=2 Tax=Treponema rectale TaxID=744512 RepID=A0A7M1XNJ8_9SPIR|nr:hypothetical protein DYE49_09770 [Treponema rectale]